MHTTMVPEQVKTQKIQAGVQVSRPGELIIASLLAIEALLEVPIVLTFKMILMMRSDSSPDTVALECVRGCQVTRNKGVCEGEWSINPGVKKEGNWKQNRDVQLNPQAKKGLVVEAYEWDKEYVSSDNNEMVEVKVLMALVDDENVVVGKESARNGEWVKIS
ncbi:hypothetical protein Tco_0770242 [Tanacetum coccineum]|uniref:Uncharacterized protein n=1 Tax=Tanacetum coccineum TaxID=301880 RepID=A0ABQ4ZCW3_9ASTR